MNANSTARATVRGTLQVIRFQNPESGFTIARMQQEDGAMLYVSGQLMGSCAGERLEAEGVWVKHSQKGWHLDIKHFTLLPPASPAALETYLAAAMLHGITPKLAARLVQAFGLDTLRVIEKTPARLTKVQGLAKRDIKQIQKSWLSRRVWNQLRMALQAPGIHRTAARLLYQTYSRNGFCAPKNLAPLRDALYALDFPTAEQLAPVLGVKADTATREAYGVRYVMKQSSEQGHVFVPRADLIRQAAELLRASDKRSALALRRLARTRELVIESDRIYRPELHAAEVAVAERLQQIQARRKSRLSEFRDAEWSKAANWLAFHSHIVLTREQQSAVQAALTSKLAILTGGPGTGKTTTVRAIVALLKRKGHTFILAAPTARAAKRLSEASGAPAQTLHRLLQFKPASPKKNEVVTAEKKFARGRTSPLSADLIIVDECSMLDLLLLNDLLQSVNPASHILFVGDPHQLPSIGAGRVLQDLIASDAVPVIALTKVMRQAKNSLIVANAHRIRQGALPVQAPRARDFLLIGAQEPKRAVRRVVDIVKTQLPAQYGFDALEDVQVLCPMNQGPASVSALNSALQAALNPPHPTKAEWKQLTRTLRVGDKVVQTRNDYERGVFNGELGRIVWVDADKQSLTVAFEDEHADYAFSEADQLLHAFALTVHKAQGCEFRAVVILLLNAHGKLLQRNLLYTAVTRARELTVLVGAPQAIARAVRNNKLTQRHSYLAARLAPSSRRSHRANSPAAAKCR